MTRLDIPTYVRIAGDLQQQITTGDLPPGARLPTEPSLMRQYGVARETIRKALDLLRHGGFAVTRQGLGTFVREEMAVETVQLQSGDEVTARMPTLDERAALGIAEGVPVVEVREAGGKVQLYAGDRTMLVTVQ